MAQDRWAETSFSWRAAGETAWTPLGTAEDDTPRIFHDVADLPVGTLIEYRAVSTDASGERVADSATAVVGADLSATGSQDGDTGEVDEQSVTLPGSHNAAMGCAGDWQPDCTSAQLDLDADSGKYTGTFDVPAGDYAFKVAIGGGWDENYGAGGVSGGEDITTHDGGPLTFWYDPVTHVVQNSAQGPFITLPGSIDAALGCPEDWMPGCMRTWMQDADGDGTFTFSTEDLPSGSYEVKVAHGGSWAESYGVDGVPDGANHVLHPDGDRDLQLRPGHPSLTIEASDPLPRFRQQLAHCGRGRHSAHEPGHRHERCPLGAVHRTGRRDLRRRRRGHRRAEPRRADPARGRPDETELEGRAHLQGFLALDLPELDRGVLEQALRADRDRSARRRRDRGPHRVADPRRAR